MSQNFTLAAEVRQRAGKGASRAVRRTGRVPAVIYGAGQPATPIHVEEKLLVRQLHTGHFMNAVVELEIERTLPRDVQFHPVTDRPVHVDFLRLAAGGSITVNVPVHFIEEDKSPGIKRGGVLNIVRHEIELTCPSDNIPEEIRISLAGREVGDSIHISAVTLPEGAKPTIDRDFTIATLVAPSALKSEEGDTATEAETPAA
jgi:large subunit ribosomal protein L25